MLHDFHLSFICNYLILGDKSEPDRKFLLGGNSLTGWQFRSMFVCRTRAFQVEINLLKIWPATAPFGLFIFYSNS